MLKIMFYINAIHAGGAERVMLNLAKFFSENGYDAILVTSFRDTWEYPVSPMVKRYSLEEQEIRQSKIARNFSRIAGLRCLCKKERPDVLIAFMAEPNFRAILATAGLKTKTIISVRNDPNREYRRKLHRIAARLLFPFANGCVFQTEEASEWFPQKLQNKSRIIMNAVKEQFFDLERKPRINEIVTCGRLDTQKNHRMLIRAFFHVHQKVPTSKLRIYGEGMEREKLQAEIVRLGLEQCVVLEGQIDDVENALTHGDVFVLSSDYEGMPNGLLEAMAAGLPCISTDCPCGGPSQVIQDGESGLLVPVNDAERMAEAILKLLGDREKMRVLGGNARKEAERFRPEIVHREWENYVREVLHR